MGVDGPCPSVGTNESPYIDCAVTGLPTPKLIELECGRLDEFMALPGRPREELMELE